MGKAVMLHVYDDTRVSGVCWRCGDPLTWFELVGSGKRHPFVVDPVYLTTRHDENRRLIGTISSDDSHFAHCPQSQSWSRK